MLCSVLCLVGLAADHDHSGSLTTTQPGGFFIGKPNMKGNYPQDVKGVTKRDTLSMSSREIAELTEKQHGHVCRDIESMLRELGESPEGYIHNWTHPQNNQAYREFRLNREHVECLLTGYSAVLRLKVIKRLREIEQQQPAPRTDAERLLITAQSLVALERGQQQLEQRIERIESGAIPPGWQTISNLSLECGLTPDKTRQFIRNFDVPHKKVPFLAPTGILTNATVADEQAFRIAFAELKRTASRPLRGVMWQHPKMGKFQMREVQA